MANALRLEIASTWDGAPLDDADRASVALESDGAGGLWLTAEARWHGDAPPDHPPGPTPKLWEHEVVECFLVGTSSDPWVTPREGIGASNYK